MIEIIFTHSELFRQMCYNSSMGGNRIDFWEDCDDHTVFVFVALVF